MSDDQIIGFAFIGGMVAVPFIMPWVQSIKRAIKSGAKRRHPSSQPHQPVEYDVRDYLKVVPREEAKKNWRFPLDC